MVYSAPKPAAPWLMLLSRSALFLIIQAFLALVFILSNNTAAWNEAARWWVFMVVVANFVSIFLMWRLFRSEGRRYLDIFRFSRSTLKKDLLWLGATSLVGLPVAAAPMNSLAAAIFGDAMVPIHMMFRPLPGWAYAIGLLFPLTIAFAELPTYFAYVMPRLSGAIRNSWLAWGLASFFLAAQHCFLPLIPDARFILWRLGMYLPFAFFTGLVLKLRPQLLPYFVSIHALMDLSTLSVYWMI